jgi:hypothetical protein
MNNREEIEGLYPESKMLFADGFDMAILGVDTNPWTKESDKDDDSTERVVYSVRNIMIILMDQGMDYDMAREHFDYNIKGGYVGVHTPIFVEDEELSEELVRTNIEDAWNEIEELDTNFNELSNEELTELRETLHARIKRALRLLSKYVPDTIGEK